ncbi:MAG: regulatory protein RecX [Spirochaetota bacterium]|nr:MAG: regulatory protein RecX [Spirochaetota bacterium]
MKITDIKNQKKRKNRFSIFIDGKYRFSLDYDTLTRSDIHIGDDIDEKKIIKLKLKDEFSKARDYGYSLISYRDRSEWELRRRLLEKGFQREVAIEVVDWFKNEGIVNDRKFANRWLDGVLQAKPMGKLRVLHELRAKRIDDEIIEEVCEKRLGYQTEMELAKKACDKRMGVLKNYPPEVGKRRLFQYMKNRGFAFEIIQELLKECFSDHLG